MSVPDKVRLLNLEDGSVTWLSTSMLTVDDSISADQLGLDSVDIQVACHIISHLY